MLPHIRLTRASRRALHDQLIHQLRQAILTGALPPGTRLPPTRSAARELEVSRNVVVLAYEQLQAEGYLDARVGAGTWVPGSLPAHLLQPGAPAPAGEAGGIGAPPPLSMQGARLAEARTVPLRRGGRPGAFLPGVADPEHFPIRIWSRIASGLWRSSRSSLVPYGEAAGYRPLREAIADHLRRHRAVRCDPEQVVVTTGAQQALDLVARMLLDPGDRVGMEDPGYRGARVAFAAAGAQLVPMPVDAEGVTLPGKGAEGLRLLYATPSHQYPLGVTLTLGRRLRLLEWARNQGSWIIEDDYDSEFRYESRPLPALQGLDREGRVIYVGTFSKILAPGLRLGFLVLPGPLVDPFRRARWVLDGHAPSILQATLAEFVGEGHLERHVARMRGIYGERREVLRKAVEAGLDGAGGLIPGAAGLHLTLRLDPGVDDRRVSSLAAEAGVEAPALSDYFIRDPERGGLVLGYGAVATGRIPDAVDRLAVAVGKASRRAGPLGPSPNL